MSQSVCPYNVKFARELADDSPFAPRDELGYMDARTFAREVLARDIEDHRAAFRGSGMKRAKLPAMKRNAAVVLGNAGKVETVAALRHALDDAEPLVGAHAVWGLTQLGAGRPVGG
jgi:epoxyqueuosine reductase